MNSAFLHGISVQEAEMRQARLVIDDIATKEKVCRKELVEEFRKNKHLRELFVDPLERELNRLSGEILNHGHRLNSDDLKAKAIAYKIIEGIVLTMVGTKEE